MYSINFHEPDADGKKKDAFYGLPTTPVPGTGVTYVQQLHYNLLLSAIYERDIDAVISSLDKGATTAVLAYDCIFASNVNTQPHLNVNSQPHIVNS